MVAPAGYSFAATTPAALASRMVSAVVLSVRYRVIRGWKSVPRAAARMRSLYAMAALASVTGGTRLGMMIARPKQAAVAGTTSFRMSPSRTCRCQSSGRVMVICRVMRRYPKASAKFRGLYQKRKADVFNLIVSYPAQVPGRVAVNRLVHWFKGSTGHSYGFTQLVLQAEQIAEIDGDGRVDVIALCACAVIQLWCRY